MVKCEEQKNPGPKRTRARKGIETGEGLDFLQ